MTLMGWLGRKTAIVNVHLICAWSKRFLGTCEQRKGPIQPVCVVPPNKHTKCHIYPNIWISLLITILGPVVQSMVSLKPASVAQLDASSDWRPGGRGFNPRRGRQHSLVEIDHEIFSTVILSLPLIQEGQLPVSGERMYTILVNRLED